MAKPDYSKFYSSRVNFVEPSPIRVMVSKIAEKSKKTRVISFAAGDPDPDVIPRELYSELARRVFLEEKRSVIYSPTEGIPELREEIARFMATYEGVNANPGDIIVTLGGSQALDLVGRLLLDPGDIVIVENPSYVNTLLTWKHYGVRLIGISMDEEGMNTHELETQLKKLKSENKYAKLVYTVATGQNPTGITLSMERRKHLLEIASQYDLLIVEDGAYNYLVYEPIEVKSIKSMDREDRVIFAGSFSKVFGTGLRVGWLHLPHELADIFKSAKGPTDMCGPVPSQLMVVRLLRENKFAEIRDRAIKAYREKRNIMLEALDKYMPNTKHTRPIAGMFIFLWLPENIDGWYLAERLLEEKSIAVIPGAPFYVDGSGKNTLRLNFSMAPKDLIEDGVKAIAELIR